MINIQEALKTHSIWLQTKGFEGKQADLQGADLQKADLQGASLQGASLQGADLQRAGLQRADLRRADLRRADLRKADLRRADLQGADLQGADLQGAILDFASWPLWCGSKNVVIDDRIAIQLIWHITNTDYSNCAPEIAKAIDSIKAIGENFALYRTDL